MIEEINEGETKSFCCFADSNPVPISTRWLNGSQEIYVTHNVAQTCYTFKNVTRYDTGNYTYIAENEIGSDSATMILIVKCKFSSYRKDTL